MRVLGIVLLVIAGLSLLMVLIGMASGNGYVVGNPIAGALSIAAIGGYLVYRANKKKEEEEKKKQWENESK